MRYIVFAAALACAAGSLSSNLSAGEASKKEPLLSNIRQVTFDGRRAGEGYFSADGRRLIFQSERETGNPFYQMYILSMESGDVSRISPGHGKTTCGWIHPDGKKALFATTQDDPKAKSKQTAELKLRASGKKRRYAWDYDENYEIQEYDFETKTYRNLTNTLGYDAEGAYSPDGRQIVFASNRQAYTGSLGDKDKKRLEHDKSYFMEIYIMNADGTNVRRLTTSPGYDGGPFFSPDGSRIVWRRFSEDGARAEVYTMNLDGSEKRRITRLGAMSWAPYFHPSGDYIIFATNLHGFANFELYLVDAEGKKDPVRVTHSDGFDGLAAFSPDGKTLTWSTTRSGHKGSQIFMADWDDAAARSLLGLTAQTPVGASAGAANTSQLVAKTDVDITEKDLKAHVATLASEEMDGRLTGTPGEARATDYMASVFKHLGLEPAGDNGSYFQPFTFNAGVTLRENNRLHLVTQADKRDLELNKQWRPLALSKIGKASSDGIVFAGFGVVAPRIHKQSGYDSYKGLNVKNKWVLIPRDLPVRPEFRATAASDALCRSALQSIRCASKRRRRPHRRARAGPHLQGRTRQAVV